MNVGSISGAGKTGALSAPRVSTRSTASGEIPDSPTPKSSDRLATSSLGKASGLSLDHLEGSNDFDVSAACSRLIAAHGNNLDNAYYEAITMRDLSASDPTRNQEILDYSHKLGMDRPLTADEMRDIEHYMFAAAFVADQGEAGGNANFTQQALAVLKREPMLVGMIADTVGYTAAKVLNKALPEQLKFLKSRTDPSMKELVAGLKGVFRGFSNE